MAYDTTLTPQNLRVQVGAEWTREKIDDTLTEVVRAITRGDFPAEPAFPWGDGSGYEAQGLRATILDTLAHPTHDH